MASLEELVRSKLIADSQLYTLLAKFNNVPAIFERTAPQDSDRGWGASQYPRINYEFIRQDVPERGISGWATFNVWSMGDQDTRPDEVEARMRAVLDNSIYQADGMPMMVLRWFRSENYQEPARVDRGGEVTYGIIVQYDMISFSVQATFEPDPISALNEWAKLYLPELEVDPEVWSPSDARPVLYFRFAGIPKTQRLNWGYYVFADIRAHVLAPSSEVRAYWGRKVHAKMLEHPMVTMDDGSQMWLWDPTWNPGADQLKAGQVTVRGQFRVLVDREVHGDTGQPVEQVTVAIAP